MSARASNELESELESVRLILAAAEQRERELLAAAERREKELREEAAGREALLRARLAVLDPSILSSLPVSAFPTFVASLTSDAATYFADTMFLPSPQLQDPAVRQAIVDMLWYVRRHGQEACVPARPDVASYACELIKKLMRLGLVTHADANPMRAWLQPHSLLAHVEDWQPVDSPSSMTMARIER